VGALMGQAESVLALMRRFPVLCWDFDGVIKDSVAAKSDAFERLFMPFGAAVATRVRQHHELNGGMSRYEKLPIYLEWAGCDCSPGEVERYSERFSAAVFQAVVDSAWVPGAREYLSENHARQSCIVITATPQREMEKILQALDIARWFREVHGAPKSKSTAVASFLERTGRRPDEVLLIGDSAADHEAARTAGVSFLLRCTSLNHALQSTYGGPQCEDFSDEQA
jgi:HAD superfamily hydrolase (TIGR01549 family)